MGDSFHVVIPSLPGYCWSTYPQIEGWTIKDTARLYNNLMTEILGYKKYAGHGGDWVSVTYQYPWLTINIEFK